jgi:hypothetical protein
VTYGCDGCRKAGKVKVRGRARRGRGTGRARPGEPEQSGLDGWASGIPRTWDQIVRAFPRSSLANPAFRGPEEEAGHRTSD